MKSITPVISVILLILLTIVASASAYFFINSSVSDLETQGGADTFPGSDGSRLNLVSVTGSRAIVRNDGTSPVTEIVIFVNDELLNFTLDTPINPGELREINYTARQTGEDLEIKVIYNLGKTACSVSPAVKNTNASGFTETPLPLNEPEEEQEPEPQGLYFAWPQRGCNSNWDNVANDGTNVTTTTPVILWEYNLTNNSLGMECYNSMGIGSFPIVIGDIDDDLMQEIIMLSSSPISEGNKVWVFNHNGSLSFTRQLSDVSGNYNSVEKYPIVSDINKDGVADIIYMTGGANSQIVNINSSNQVQWAYNHQQTSDNEFSLVLHLANVTNDDYYEIVSSENVLLQVINASGMDVWNYTGSSVMTGIGMDSTNDGLDEIYAFSGDGNGLNIISLSSQGNLIDTFNYQSPKYYLGGGAYNKLNPTQYYLTFSDYNSNAIKTLYPNGLEYDSVNIMLSQYQDFRKMAFGNLTGGNWMDLVFNVNHHLYVFNSMDFSTIWDTNTLGSWSESGEYIGSPVIGDINGDGQLDVIAYKENNLYAFRGNNGQEIWNIQVANANYLSNAIEGKAPKLVLADINKDGKLDIIISVHNTDDGSSCNELGYNLFERIVAVTTE